MIKWIKWFIEQMREERAAKNVVRERWKKHGHFFDTIYSVRITSKSRPDIFFEARRDQGGLSCYVYGKPKRDFNVDQGTFAIGRIELPGDYTQPKVSPWHQVINLYHEYPDQLWLKVVLRVDQTTIANMEGVKKLYELGEDVDFE